jgi:hypothetical protein
MLLHGIASAYAISDAVDIATGNILTTTSATYVAVPGITSATIMAALGDVLLIACAYVIRADSGTTGRAVVMVNDNGTLVEGPVTDRTSDAVGGFVPVTTFAKYVMANGPASGAGVGTLVTLRAKRASGAGNAYVSSPTTLTVIATRGL